MARWPLAVRSLAVPLLGGRNDYFPYTYADLRSFDAATCREFEALWGLEQGPALREPAVEIGCAEGWPYLRWKASSNVATAQ